MKDPDEGSNRAIGEGYALMSVGITFALALAGFTLVGFWLDGRLHTAPLLTILGMVLGMALGGFWLWQRIGRQSKGSGSKSG
ncbi:MAG: AtpZ/AtpI family protein [Gemmatimonadales bacterium]